jgi:hypothetical protein
MWLARDAVARAWERLEADKMSLDYEDEFSGVLRPEAVQAVLKDVVVDQINADAGSALAEWAVLADRHPETPVDDGYRQYLAFCAAASSPRTPVGIGRALSWLSAAASYLENALDNLRRDLDGPTPEERAIQALLAGQPERVVGTAHSAVEAAVSRLSASVGGLDQSGVGEAERLAASRAVLAGVMDELKTRVAPVLTEWVALAGHGPFGDQASGYVGIALHAFREASAQAAGFLTQTAIERVEWQLRQARDYLARSVYHPHPEPDSVQVAWAQSDVRPYTPPVGFPVVVAAVVTAAAVPFLKTLITKSAEDTYTATRSLLRKLFRLGRPAKRGPRSESRLLIVEDPSPQLKLAIHLGVDTPDKALEALKNIDLDTAADDAKRRKVKNLTIRWDQATQSWKTYEH